MLTVNGALCHRSTSARTDRSMSSATRVLNSLRPFMLILLGIFSWSIIPAKADAGCLTLVDEFTILTGTYPPDIGKINLPIPQQAFNNLFKMSTTDMRRKLISAIRSENPFFEVISIDSKIDASNTTDLSNVVWNGQSIVPNSRADRAMISESNVDGKPVEVGKIEVQSGNRAFLSESFQGTKDFISTEAILDQVLNYINVLRSNGQLANGIKEITIHHTHPYWEIRFRHGNTMQSLVLPLNENDLGTAAQISQRLPFPLRIRAILPNGFSYEAEFLRGQRVR